MPVVQESKKLGRKEVTKTLTQSVVNHFARKNFSSYVEVGVLPWGKRRIDVLAMSFKGHFIGIEIKSCSQDYQSDSKWRDYLPFFNRMYFCIPEYLWDDIKFKSLITSDTKPHGVGILVCSNQGSLRVVQNAKKHVMEKSHKTKILLKLAWKGGQGRHNIKNRYERLSLLS